MAGAATCSISPRVQVGCASAMIPIIVPNSTSTAVIKLIGLLLLRRLICVPSVIRGLAIHIGAITTYCTRGIYSSKSGANGVWGTGLAASCSG